MKRPTKKQTFLLEFIKEFTAKHNFSPSYREIMRAMNLSSVSAVAEHIDNCVAAGLLKKIPNAPRSLEIIEPVDIDATINNLHRVLSEHRFTSPDVVTLRNATKILTKLKD